MLRVVALHEVEDDGGARGGAALAFQLAALGGHLVQLAAHAAQALLGVAAMYTVPEFPAGDIINAIAVGIVSGLSATGADQIAKQMKK